jgi:hypothetical protein
MLKMTIVWIISLQEENINESTKDDESFNLLNYK